MPFKIGVDPIRFSLKYLEAGTLVFKPRVRIMMSHFNTDPESHNGLRQFMHWFTPQIQYKNPQVQILSMENLLPSPFIRFFLDDDEEVIVDTEWKCKEDILSHIKTILGKSDSVLRHEQRQSGIASNKFNFGTGFPRQCVCELPGQVPCPHIVPLPKHWRGKYKSEADSADS